tara:strand:- start:40 stop:288 length:249 start_codon:yes stop_codon:yes gene_type:complete
MYEIYQIRDRKTNSAHNAVFYAQLSKIQDEIKHLNRRHAENTVAAILMLKAPKSKKGNKDLVQEYAHSMADGRYFIKTSRVQ